MRYSVDETLVEKRAKCVNSQYDKPDCKAVYERAVNSIKNEKLDKNDIIRFFTECESPSNANNYYKECISLIESVEDNKLSKTLKERYMDKVIPYVYDMSQLIKEAGYMDDKGFASGITNTAKKYEICDRILDNHAKISKRFTIENFVDKSRNKSLDRIVIPCCNMIDTYDLKPHAKMNVCLEEVSYLLQKNGIKYKKEDLVKYITEYFLTRNPKTSVDTMNNYRIVLNENSMISDQDLRKVRYFTEMTDDSDSPIVQRVHNFMTDDNKSLGKLCALIDFTFYEAGKEDLIANLECILDYIREYAMTDDETVDTICTTLEKAMSKVEDDMSNDTWRYTREDLDELIGVYQKELDCINTEIDGVPDPERMKFLSKIKDGYIDSIGRLTSLAGIVYPSYNANCIAAPQQSMTSESMSMEEFEHKKFKRLLREASTVDMAVNLKGNKLTSATRGKLEKRTEKKSVKENTLQSSLTSENTIDICVAEYSILDEKDFYKVQDILTEFCKNINDTYLSESDAACYYVVKPDTVEIHVEDSAECIDGNDAIVDFSDEDKEKIVDLQAEASLIGLIDDTERFANISNEIKESIEWMDRDRFDLLIEVAKYDSVISKDDIAEFGRMYSEEHDNTSYLSESVTKRSVADWQPYEDVPLSIQIESYDIICSILEADDEKDKINKEKEDKAKEEEDKKKQEEKNNAPHPLNNNNDKDKNKDNKKDDKDKKKKIENPFKGIKLNDLKLYAKGLQAKMKDMGNKEKQWCRDIDMTFNRLYKGITDSLTNDRREAIIKGSVIPSFSKCVKLAIVLAGLGIATSNPIVPAVAAIAGLACSKNLNKKERLLLLDEIEVEMEVLDKEIQMAESNDQTKKLRKLLMYKKDLQRQYQRIRYNIRVGKDIMPGTASGMRTDNG